MQSRRSFLQAAGVAGIGFGLFGIRIREALALEPLGSQAELAGALKRATCGLIRRIAPEHEAAQLTQRVYGCGAVNAPRTGDFHQRCGSSIILVGATISAFESARGGTYFSLDRFALHDISNPCQSHKDFNAAEMLAVVGYESDYGTVLAACGHREPVKDVGEFEETVAIRGQNPKRYRPEYVRNFNDGHGRVYHGYGALTKDPVAPQRAVFLTPAEV